MSNPLFQQFGMQMPSQFMQMFNQFKSTFAGDPKKQVEQLLSSGKMSQEQFNQLSSMATQIRKMMP